MVDTRHFVEAVPKAAHRADVNRICGIVFHFLAQAEDVDIYSPIRDCAVMSPDRVEQLLKARVAAETRA